MNLSDFEYSSRISSVRNRIKHFLQWLILRCGYCQVRDLVLGWIGKVPVTILCYHVIGNRAHPNNIHPEVFQQQVQFIKTRYTIISLEQAIACLKSGRPNHTPFCCITFDDGYCEAETVLLPILKKLKITSAVFVISGCVTAKKSFPDDERRGLIDFLPMTWEQILKLSNNGVSIGSHTVNHVDCGEKNNLVEMFESKKEIEEHIGVNITLFAFPYGRRDTIHPDAAQILKEAGYETGFSCFGGVNYPLHRICKSEQQRVPILKRIHIAETQHMIEMEFQLRLQELIYLRLRISTFARWLLKTN